jgi:hypothetical protein
MKRRHDGACAEHEIIVLARFCLPLFEIYNMILRLLFFLERVSRSATAFNHLLVLFLQVVHVLEE